MPKPSYSGPIEATTRAGGKRREGRHGVRAVFFYRVAGLWRARTRTGDAKGFRFDESSNS